MISLLLRNFIFTILQPGIVAGLLPYLLLKYEGKTFVPHIWQIWQIFGFILILVGIIILIICILMFAFKGKGTLSPIDPTRKLVFTGLYKYSRNPMYVGVLLLLFGEAIFTKSLLLILYSIIIFICFHLFIIFHEEPRLNRDFSDEYKEYCQKVRRWL